MSDRARNDARIGSARASGGLGARFQLWAVHAIVHGLSPFNLAGFGKISRAVRRLPIAGASFAEVQVGDTGLFSYPMWDDYWPRWLLRGQAYEYSLEILFRRLSGHRFGFVDAGANFGYWSVLMSDAALGAHASVGVEAAPETFCILERNSRLNRTRFIPLNRAVCDASGGSLRFAVGGNHVASRIVDNEGDLLPRERLVRIQGITLADIAEQYLPEEKSLLIKLDVEGAEIRGFMGAERLADRDTIFVYEDHGADRDSKVTEWLLVHGYTVLHPEEDGVLRRVFDIEALQRIKADFRTGYNFLALRGTGPLSEAVLSLIDRR